MMKTFLLLFFLCTMAVFAEDYQIYFDSTYVKGQKFKIEIKANLEEVSKMSIDGKVVMDKNNKIKLEGSSKVEILEINAKGFPTKAKMIIDVLKANEVEVLPENTEVLVELSSDDKTTHTINNVVASPEISKYLSNIFKIKSSKKPMDQECFGSAKPVKVGEEWDVNKDAFIKGLADEKLKITENFKVNGKCKLNSVNKVNELDLLNVSCDLTFSGIELPLPGKINYEKGEVAMKFSGIFPNGKNKNRIEETEDSNFELKGNGEVTRNNVSKKMEMNMKSHDIINRKFIY